MNEIYEKVLAKLEVVDPALAEAILAQALKAAGTTPEDVTIPEMKEAYELHLEKVLKKYPSSAKVKAVLNTINTLGSDGFADRQEAKSAAARGEKLKDGRITEVLYAQPSGEEPFLVLPKLKEGIYEEGPLWGLTSVLRFTKVGGAFWWALNKSAKKVMVKLDEASQLEDYKAWTISLSTKDLTTILQCVRYRPFASFPAAFYVRIQMDGDSGKAKEVVSHVVDHLTYVPYNMNDWAAFEKKVNRTESALKQDWGKFL